MDKLKKKMSFIYRMLAILKHLYKMSSFFVSYYGYYISVAFDEKVVLFYIAYSQVILLRQP